MKNKEIQINEKILVYVLSVLFLIQPIAISCKWVNIFLPIKTIITFIFAIVIILLLFATNLIKDIRSKFILIPISIISLMMLLSVISVLLSQYYEVLKFRHYLWFGDLGNEEGVIFWGLNLVFMVAGYFIFIKRDYLNKIFTAMTISSVLVSLDGITQYLFNKDFLLGIFMGYSDISRFFSRQQRFTQCFSTLGNQNYVGNFLSITIPITVGMFIYKIDKYYGEKENKTNLVHAVLYYIAALIEFAALICTRTRGAWLGVSLGFLVFIIIFRKREYRKTLLIIFAGFFIAAGLINLISQGQIMSRAGSIVTEGKAAANGNKRVGASRPFVWKVTINQTKKHPLIGSGTNSFPLFFPKSRKISMKYWGRPNIIVKKAHNEYLHIAATMGIPATVIYILFIIGLLILTIKKSRDKYINLVICSIIAYSISIFFSFSITFYSVWFFFLIGIIFKNLLISMNKIEDNDRN